MQSAGQPVCQSFSPSVNLVKFKSSQFCSVQLSAFIRSIQVISFHSSIHVSTVQFSSFHVIQPCSTQLHSVHSFIQSGSVCSFTTHHVASVKLDLTTLNLLFLQAPFFARVTFFLWTSAPASCRHHGYNNISVNLVLTRSDWRWLNLLVAVDLANGPPVQYIQCNCILMSVCCLILVCLFCLLSFSFPIALCWSRKMDRLQRFCEHPRSCYVFYGFLHDDIMTMQSSRSKSQELKILWRASQTYPIIIWRSSQWCGNDIQVTSCLYIFRLAGFRLVG